MSYLNHKKILLQAIIIMLANCNLLAQLPQVYVFDNKALTMDSIAVVDVSQAKDIEKLKHHEGSNGTIQVLDLNVNTALTYPNSTIYPFRKASDSFNIEAFPISAVSKIFILDTVTLKIHDVCSATMIGPNLALAAAHCFTKWPINKAPVFDKKLQHMVCPVYDNGKINSTIECASISKLHLFTNSRMDFAIIELNKSIGLHTGWLGLAYTKDDEVLKNKLYYNFSYPATKSQVYQHLDSTIYNGDTLYYRYGKLAYINENCLYCGPIPVINGQSGSSLFEVENYIDYSIYGVMTSVSCHFNRISAELFTTCAQLLDLNSTSNDTQPTNEYTLYPNPVENVLHIDFQTTMDKANIILFDAEGRFVKKVDIVNTMQYSFDFSCYTKGQYYVVIQRHGATSTYKIIKI
jgi:V8-like Glu-specific endopeptidase